MLSVARRVQDASVNVSLVSCSVDHRQTQTLLT